MAGFKSKVNLRRGHGQYRTEALRLENSVSRLDDWNSCTKQKHHRRFLNPENVSAVISDNDIVEFVKVRAKLTGRLVISLGDEQQYSTCLVEEVVDYPTKIPSQGLSSDSTESLSRPRAVVTVSTALHAVCVDGKQIPGNLCHVELDYDDSKFISDEKKDQSHVLYGKQIYEKNEDTDHCLLRCVTDNAELINRLSDLIQQHYELGSLLEEKYSNIEETDRDVIIVSYPHGYSKRVSIGKVRDKEPIKEVRDYQEHCDYTYDTATCPGSSGASVYILGKWREGFCYWFGHPHVHSGAYDDFTGQSSGGVDAC